MPARPVLRPVAPALLAWLAFAAPAPAQSSSDDHELVLACRGALWARTFDDATAAGLNPGAVVTSFEGRKAQRTREGGTLVLTGTEEYRPVTDVDAFPVRYECRVDVASRKVESVSYAALDATGAPITASPIEVVGQLRYVESCSDRLEQRLDAEASKRGASGAAAEVEIARHDVTFAPAPGTIELSGTGRARFGKEFEWQALAFTCRYDQKKREATRSSHRLEAGAPEQSLPTASRDALDACRLAVEDQVLDDAVRRGYRRLQRVRIELPRLATIASRGSLVDVSGKGQFKLDPRHEQPTPISFSCVYDADARAIATARFDVEAGAWTPSGEIASGRTGTLRCESLYDVQKQCPAAIKGSVTIVREFGRSKCEAYKNWIWSPSGITVWGGCRAEFEFEAK